MRILHVIESLEPAKGGPPAVAARLAAAQQRLGHDVSLLCYCPPERRPAIEEHYRPVPSFRAIGKHYLWPPWDVRELLGTGGEVYRCVESCDIVHMHGVWEPMLRVAAA